jgi:hypothetical protein
VGLEASRNVILSAGGKHGAGGTILRGQPIPAGVAQFLPTDAVTQVPTAAPAVPAKAPEAPAVEVPVPSEPASPEAPSEPSPIKGGSDEAAAIPTSRAKLKAMSFDAVRKVSRDLGLTFAEDTPEREVRDRLSRELELK